MKHAIVDTETGEVLGDYKGKLNMTGMEFMLFFGKNLSTLVKSNPSKKDIILAEILFSMNRANVVSLQKHFKLPLSKRIKVNISYVSKVIKELESKKVLLRIGRGVYVVNPYLYGKGRLTDISKLRWEFDAIFDKNGDVELNYEINKIYERE